MSNWEVMTNETYSLLQKALDTFGVRNAVYRDNHQRLGATLQALFPDGITLNSIDEHERFALLMLAIVKLTRYTVEWNNGGHRDSAHDLIVYAAMLEARTHDNRRKHGRRGNIRTSLSSAEQRST